MFGYHKARRERKRAERDKELLNQEKEAFSPQRQAVEAQELQNKKQNVNQSVQEAKQSRQQARQEGRTYAEDVLNREKMGLSPTERSNLQYAAQRQIDREHQNANRRLLGEQGRRGVVGRGGVGYAQQRDLQRMANEGYDQARRDIDMMDERRKMQNLAASFNIEQGEAAQSQLDRQLAIDELNLENEIKRQRLMEDKFNSLFNRI